MWEKCSSIRKSDPDVVHRVAPTTLLDVVSPRLMSSGERLPRELDGIRRESRFPGDRHPVASEWQAHGTPAPSCVLAWCGRSPGRGRRLSERRTANRPACCSRSALAHGLVRGMVQSDGRIAVQDVTLCFTRTIIAIRFRELTHSSPAGDRRNLASKGRCAFPRRRFTIDPRSSTELGALVCR